MIDPRTFYNFANAPLYIGYHGENLVTGVDIDLANVLPDGWTAALLLRRAGETTVYPAASTLVGKLLRVTYSTADSSIEGRGEATIQFMGGNGEIKKSATAQTIVEHALDISGDPPEPVEQWLEQMEKRLIPPGGTDGQVLTKTGAADYSAEWKDPRGGGGDKPYLSLERVSRYLYNVSFANAPDVDADFVPAGGCSAYVQDGKLYRNLDWSYDHEATFHVKLPGIEGLAFMAGLTDTALDDDLIAQLPYRMVDGVNEHGIMISTHLLYNDWTWSGTGNIPLTRLPYLALSRVKSMATVETDLADVLDDLRSTPALDDLEYLIQVLVTDGETSCVLSPTTDDPSIYEIIDVTENPKLSNFLWVDDATVARADLQTRPTGVERWNMMPCTLEELRFTAAYEEATRLSEFIGLRGTTKDSTDAELTAIYNDAHALYLDRQRDGSTWQTMHSAVYSPKGLEHLWIQEDWGKDYIASSGGDAEPEIVYFEYGVATFDEVKAAYDAGKTIKVTITRDPDYPDNIDILDLNIYRYWEEDDQVFGFTASSVDDSPFSHGELINGLATLGNSTGWAMPLISRAYTAEKVDRFVDNLERTIDGIANDLENIGSRVDDAESEIELIERIIPPAADVSNKLVTESQMGDAVEAVEAKQIYKTATQGSFATKAELIAATTFYNADGTVATPTKNDVAYVLADESHDGKAAKYVIASVDEDDLTITWGFVITFSNTSFTQAQMDAINSGATAGKIEEISKKYVKSADGIPKTDLTNAVQSSLDKADAAIPATEKGVSNGVATLGTDGKVPNSQLPAVEVTAENIASALGYTPADRNEAYQILNFNQLANANDSQSSTESGVTITFDEQANTMTLNGTATENITKNYIFRIRSSIIGERPNHACIISMTKISGDCAVSSSRIDDGYATSASRLNFSSLTTGKVSKLYNIASSGSMGVVLRLTSGDSFSNLVLRVQYFDLTQMFGAGKEPSLNAFLALFPAAYYPYEEGKEISVPLIQEVVRLGQSLPTALADLTQDRTHRTVTDAEKTGWNNKADKPIIKSVMDSVAIAGAQYYLGEQSAVDIVLPSGAETGQQITAVWYNGATAATLSITGTMLDCDYAPSANSRSEINALWDGTYWAVVTNEQAVPV